MTRTTCFMALPGAVLNYYFVEVRGRRQRDACGAFADADGSGLLRVCSVLLVGLNDDAVLTQGNRLVFIVETVPLQVILPWRSCRACDGSQLIFVSPQEAKCRRKLPIIFRLVAPQREDANKFA